MNTFKDLQTELDRLADEAPSDADIRQAIAERSAAHGKRRRTTALIAVAASVVLIAGGASVTAAVLSHQSDGTAAAPSAVVQVPEVPLPADTQLIRHSLQQVDTPITATPPDGLTGKVWVSAPGRLAVWWFDPSAASDGMSGAPGPPGEPGPDATTAVDPGSAGYVITDSRNDELMSFGAEGPTAPTVSHREMMLGGRSVTVDTAPSDTDDRLGLPAEERISWQLPDGRWIHVWAAIGDGESSPSSELKNFAKTISETPQTLDRTIGIGLALPGLTVDSSMNATHLVGIEGASLFLCPEGVDPMAPSYSSSSGSGSVGPDGTTTSTETNSSQDPTAQCVAATVLNYPDKASISLPAGRLITVGDTVAHVSTESGSAWAELPDGLLAVAAGPESADLSDEDLAALVASVRLSPDVVVLPGSGFVSESDSVGSSSSVVASTVASMSMSTVPPPSVSGSDSSSSASSETTQRASASSTNSGAPDSGLSTSAPVTEPATETATAPATGPATGAAP